MPTPAPTWLLLQGRRIGQLARDLDRHNALSAANAMAFDAFLSLIPLLAIAGWVLERLHREGNVVLSSLLQAAPGPAQSLAAAEFLRLSSGQGAIPPISLVVFLYVTSSGLSTAISELETIAGSVHRPWWRRRLLAASGVIFVIVAVIVIAAVAIAIAGALGEVASRVIGVMMPIGITVGMLSLLFWVAVDRPKVKRVVLPGALVAVGLWALSSAGFSIYVKTLARYATLYGSLAAVAILMFWLWLLSLAVLVGAEINRQLEGRQHPEG